MAKESDKKELTVNRQVLEQLPTPVLTVDKTQKITFLNQAGCEFINRDLKDIVGKSCDEIFNSKFCNTSECKMRTAVTNGEQSSFQNEFSVNGSTRYVECHTAPLRDDEGNIIGGVESIIDLTQRVLDDKKLREQSAAIREMSTPTIKLWEGILVLPIIGVIDSARAQFMMESILNKILTSASKVIILDIHGVATVDTAVANHLIKITRATRLMGCDCLLTGISPDVAQTIVHLGIDMNTINTTATLSDALAEAFRLLGIMVTTSEG